MLVENKIIVKWNKKSKKHYEEKGYIFTNYGDEFECRIEDLNMSNCHRVKLICDYCEKLFDKAYHHYLDSKDNSIINKDCCTECKHLKAKESNLINYGVINVFQLDEIKSKNIDTCLSKYGVENYTQTDEYNIKSALTNINKYGKKFYTQTEEYARRKTITCLEKYGFDNPMKNINVKSKLANILYQNGTAPTSQQQTYIHQLIGGELNYPVGSCNLDIAFPEDMIYIEYDGSGHGLSVKFGNEIQEDFDNRNKRRNYFLYRRCWKEIRIISKKDKLPTDKVILEMIDYAKNYINTGHSWIHFDIDNSKIITSQFEIDYNYGQLRKIKNINKDKEIAANE